jgi:hypothetical protein
MSQPNFDFNQFVDWIQKGWSQWLPLDKASVKTIPPLPGVYEIRVKNYSFPRLQGQTSTIYIGCAEKRELVKRLNGLTRDIPSKSGVRTRRTCIEKVKSGLQKELEFRYRCETEERAKEVEQELLMQYETQHLELPPCNHNI